MGKTTVIDPLKKEKLLQMIKENAACNGFVPRPMPKTLEEFQLAFAQHEFNRMFALGIAHPRNPNACLLPREFFILTNKEAWHDARF